jgi:hypothetical protein
MPPVGLLVGADHVRQFVRAVPLDQQWNEVGDARADEAGSLSANGAFDQVRIEVRIEALHEPLDH